LGNADAVIALKTVSFSYDEVHWILKGISLEVSKGEWVVVLGHNGSGKSTLVKILGALQIPSRGACFVCGRDTRDGASLADIHRRVSLVFQDPESQIVGAMVEDDVAFAPENQGLDASEIERRIDWALKKVGLSRKRGALSSALSGGEKQRLALAGALAADAVCLVLDEPTSMLDPEGRIEVEEILRDLHASGTTIVQVTHRLEDVVEADRALVLSQGQWAWQGRSEDFWDRAELLGFRLPPSLELKRRLASRGVAAPSSSVADLARAVAEILPKTGEERKSTDFPMGPASCWSDSFQSDEERVAPPHDILFETRGLGHSFHASTPLEVRVLKNVSCLVPKGKWCSVLGRTGSGKSTLIQHLNGLYAIQSGEIFMEGKPLSRRSAELRDLRRRIGLVFQSPEDQLFSPTVYEELAFAPRNWGFSAEDADRSVRRAIENVGLGEAYLERNPLRLSGGERRLVAIASTLSADPECVVLDEPTAGLDARYRGKILALLSRLKEAGKTIVTVTHDFEMAFEYSDRLLVMDEGAKICEESVRQALPVLLETGASMLPKILRITSLLRERGASVPLTWDVNELFAKLVS
jgi:energy-coupling factor transport system ATP-binding protein